MREKNTTTRREEWQRILDVETKKWSVKSCEQILTELREMQCYQIEEDSKAYQFEVEILENTDKYIHVAIAVDDGSLPASISPSTNGIIFHKNGSGTQIHHQKL